MQESDDDSLAFETRSLEPHFAGRQAVCQPSRLGTEMFMEARSEFRDLPYDSMGNVDVPGAPGWSYSSITGSDDGAIMVNLAGPDDIRERFVVPTFMSRGDELGEVARIVIRAWERADRASGLGG